MNRDALGPAAAEHYREAEIRQAQRSEALSLNGAALLEMRNFMEMVFPGTGDIPVINLGEVYHHPEKGAIRAAAMPIAWQRRHPLELRRLTSGTRSHFVAQIDPSRADAITVGFYLVDEEAVPTYGSESLTMEYYGPYKGVEDSRDVTTKEIQFDTSEEALSTARLRFDEVFATIRLLSEAAADPELNPELASRLAAA